jgi:hypothetical protein
MKFVAVGGAVGALVLLTACGSSKTPTATVPQSALATPAITPVATTYLGTPPPGATPRVHVTPAPSLTPTPAPAGAGPATPPALPSGLTPQTQPDGLQIIDITQGTGPAAQTGQTVTVNYTGWLQSNGTKFDSSLDRNQPFSFPLGQGQVIKGWDEGVVGMKVGGKRRLIIPPALGYGSTPNGKIPANSTLIFDIDLLSNGVATATPASPTPGTPTP